MPIPFLHAVESDVNLICGAYQVIGQFWGTAGTENCSAPSKSSIHVFIPSAPVSEFDHVTPGRIKLAQDGFQARCGVTALYTEMTGYRIY